MPEAGSATVGIIANPASGRDIRRLVSGASVFDNAEKGNMVYRLMVGLGATGVDKVLVMPAASGLYDSLDRALRGNDSNPQKQTLPEFEFLEMTVRHAARDTVEAVDAMCERGVSAIVVLGGDGTNRIVARHCGPDMPLCTLSTGTNNAFPEMREATVAGIATGLVATGKVSEEALRREKILRVGLNDDPRHDCALVDVAVTSERFVGARALWRPGEISELFVTSARPDAVGLSSVAGLLGPVPRSTKYGLHVRFTDPESAETVLNIPLAPGLVVPMGVAEVERMGPEEPVEVESVSGSLALDGEREIEVGPNDRISIHLDVQGPLMIDVGAAMSEAAQHSLLKNASRNATC